MSLAGSHPAMLLTPENALLILVMPDLFFSLIGISTVKQTAWMPKLK